MKVIIIGGGVLGCSASLAMARSGMDVTVVERHGQVGHGSTSASCAIVRRFYSQAPMIAMAHEGAQCWEAWADYLGPMEDALAEFRRPGVLFLPPTLDDQVHAVVANMKEVGVPVSLLGPDEIKAKFPFMAVTSNYPACHPSDPAFFDLSEQPLACGVYEPDGGYIASPTLATHNLRQAATREGATFCLNTLVTAIETMDDGSFQIHTQAGKTMEANVVVNISGPHSGQINRMAGVVLPLETRPLRREVHALANPTFVEGQRSLPVVGDLDGGIYFRPELGGREIIVGSTEPVCDRGDQEWLDDPDTATPHVTDSWFQRQTVRLMKRIPDVKQGPRRGVAGVYDVTVADWYPIVDKTDLPGYYVCIGTSGSSFKTAPVIGPMLTGLIEATENGHDLDQYGLDFHLPRIGRTVNTRFLSRLRGKGASSGTVIG